MGTKEKIYFMEEDVQKALLRRKITWILPLLIFAAVVFIICSSFIARAGSRDKSSAFKYYTEVRVGRQDTLWRIANEYMTDEYESIDDYIEEVMNINSLFSPEDLQYGQRIIVPYYSSEWKS